MYEVFELLPWTDFVAVLPVTSRAFVISSIAAGGNSIDVARQLAAAPASGLAAKGGIGWPPDLVQRFLDELWLLCCTDDVKYKTVRDNLRGQSSTTASAVVALITTAISQSVGLAYALCFPVLATLLGGVAKSGVAAWCQAVAPPQLPTVTPPAIDPPQSGNGAGGP